MDINAILNPEEIKTGEPSTNDTTSEPTKSSEARKCRDCSQPTNEFKTRCDDCNEKANTQGRARAASRLELNKCVRCGEETPQIGFRTCVECRAQETKRKQKVQAEAQADGKCKHCRKDTPREGSTWCESCLEKAKTRKAKK